MTQRASQSGHGLGTLATAFGELKALMGDLGLNLWIWDAGGQAIEPFEPCYEFCRTVGHNSPHCRTTCGRFAEKIVAGGEAAWEQVDTGCCLIGAPLRRRRRVLGAAVACFPTRQMLDEESLARLCERLKLDRQVVSQQAAICISHSAGQCPGFLRVLSWALVREQRRLTVGDELQSLSTNLSATYEELSLLYRISGSMQVTQAPDEFLQNICGELLEVANIALAAAVVYAHAPETDQDLVLTAGRLGLSEDQLKALVERELAANSTSGGAPILRNIIRPDDASGFGGEVRNLLVVPLVGDEETIGAIVALNKLTGDFDSIDLKLMGAVGNQAAVFLTNNRLYADLQGLLMGVLHALTASIDAKDPYTCGHSQRVALISRRLAEECGFSPEKVQQIYLAGLLHDIGKIGVPETILRKKGRLTEEEYDVIKRHPLLGANILGGIRQLDDIVVGILSHHERPDGKGYPRGLKGDQVPMEGRILCLADCFDAMTSVRTYREALPLPAAIEEIRNNAGAQFDVGVVETFLSIDLKKFAEETKQPAKTVFPFGLQTNSR